MALFVIERNLAEQLQRSRDAARRVTEISRDIGVVMHNPVRRHECLRLAVAARLVVLPAAAAKSYPSKPIRIVVPSARAAAPTAPPASSPSTWGRR